MVWRNQGLPSHVPRRHFAFTLRCGEFHSSKLEFKHCWHVHGCAPMQQQDGNSPIIFQFKLISSFWLGILLQQKAVWCKTVELAKAAAAAVKNVKEVIVEEKVWPMPKCLLQIILWKGNNLEMNLFISHPAVFHVPIILLQCSSVLLTYGYLSGTRRRRNLPKMCTTSMHLMHLGILLVLRHFQRHFTRCWAFSCLWMAFSGAFCASRSSSWRF